MHSSDRLRQNGPFNYGTHWGIDPYGSGYGMQPYSNPYHGSMGLGTDPTATDGGASDIGQSSLLHVVLAAAIGGAVSGFASWDLSRAGAGAAALGGLAASYDGVTALTNQKPGLGLALIAVGALGVFVAYTNARQWNTRHIKRENRSSAWYETGSGG